MCCSGSGDGGLGGLERADGIRQFFCKKNDKKASFVTVVYVSCADSLAL